MCVHTIKKKVLLNFSFDKPNFRVLTWGATMKKNKTNDTKHKRRHRPHPSHIPGL